MTVPGASPEPAPATAPTARRPPFTEVRWGIIGVGDVTERKSGPGLQHAERSSLVAVMRRDGAKAADYARRHGVPRWYDDADALIADPEVDAVYVATPPDSHRDYVLRVAAAGKPVYVEKPMARTAAECEEMIAACEDAGVPLFVAYYRRAMPRFITVGRLLADGVIGTVRAVRVLGTSPGEAWEPQHLPWRVRPEISGGGLFVDLASHTLDLLDHLLGPISAVSGTASNQAGRHAAEDTVAAAFTLGGSVQGSGLWCYAAGERLDEVEVIGTAGSLVFSSFGTEPLRVRTAEGERTVEAPYPEVVQQPLIQAVVDELTGRGSAPSTGRSALRTARAVDAVLAGYRAERGITF